jgi:hypothetical protein
VVVEAGLATVLPEAGRVPPAGDMLTDVTPVTFQFRMEFPPGLMLAGLAVKERITGDEAGGGEGGGDEVGGGEVGGGEVGGSEVGGSEVGGGEVGGGEVGGDEVGGDEVITATVTDWETVPAVLVAIRV